MMSSPFRSTPSPFMEIPVPSSDFEESAPPRLEDVPFRRFGIVGDDTIPDRNEAVNTPTAARGNWFTRLFSRRNQGPDPVLNELTELRASYAGLLGETREIRERLDRETEERTETVNRVLSPFPAAMEGLRAVRNRQEEVSDVLFKIRDQVGATAERDTRMLESMEDFGLGLAKVDETVAGMNESIFAMKDTMGDFTTEVRKASGETLEGVERVQECVRELESNSRERAERQEQDSEDVLFVLRRMERNSQRAMWVCALLLGAVLVTLMVLALRTGTPAAKATDMGAEEDPSLVAADGGSRVLVD